MYLRSWKARLSTVALALGILVALPASAAQAGPSAVQDSHRPAVIQVQTAASFYRLFNPSNGDHFHTTSLSEVISAITYRRCFGSRSVLIGRYRNAGTICGRGTGGWWRRPTACC
jgi:Repeat of unknown function (DUF5648)